MIQDLSRRRTWWLLCVLLSLAVVGPRSAIGQILFVGAAPDHPRGSHMYQQECTLLRRCVEQSSAQTTRMLTAWPTEAETEGVKLQDLRGLVFYSSPAGDKVLSPPHRELFLQWMDEGVGLVAIHWGTGVGYSQRADSQALRDEYMNALGGWFRRPPGDVQIGETDLHLVDATHPIVRGWQPSKTRDEFYLNPILHPRAQPLLQVQVDQQTHTVAWTFERQDGGRSVGITLGHFHENFVRDDFRRLLTNAILWASRVEVPQVGASVDLPAGDLQLPAAP